ncbi:transglutaminase family protein [Aestuariibacter salexigens]|uniref:transglutaminase family protein n=1 Tax=Aestuariibacter salexigens TaxID=226010 RepID=UPI00040DCE3F|nr:transglutaminase family protein [Aestuariibacter salexigens]
MKYQIRHVTTYRYTDKVSLTQNHARLTPLNTFQQQCLSSAVTIIPEPDYQVSFQDHFDNIVTVFEIPTLHEEMQVIATSEVDLQGVPIQGLFSHQVNWESVRDQIKYPADNAMLQALTFSLPTRLTQANQDILNYTLASFTPNRPIVEACDELMARIFADFTFDPAFSTINTPVSHVFEHKRGVCQDFAHLTLACIRSIGLSARYVSGYIETLPPPGQEKLTGADATHAWISLFVPGSGWIDFDPTNNLKPYDQHVTLAVGRDFADITPLKGVMFGGGNQQLDVSVDMNRI